MLHWSDKCRDYEINSFVAARAHYKRGRGFPFLSKRFWLSRLRRRQFLRRENFYIFRRFLHCGNVAVNAFYFGLLESKAEIEADALATIAMAPRFALASFDFLEKHPNRFARQLYRNRQKLDFFIKFNYFMKSM